MDEAHKPVVYKFDDMSTSSEGSYAQSEKRKRARLCYALLFLIVTAALATITAGVVLLRSARERQLAEEVKREQPFENTTAKPTNASSNVLFMKEIKDLDEYCEPSAEAQRIKLNAFLEKCQQLFYKINPHQELVARNSEPQEVLNDIVRRFKPFIPTPENLKETTDEIELLRQEIDSMDYNEAEMKPKENQAVSEIKAVLSQMMSLDFEAGFYEGGWMFSPGYFCSNRICRLQEEIKILTFYYRPRNVEEVEVLYNIFIQYNDTFNQHIENLKLGVRSGMIKSRSACEVGIKAFKDINMDVLFRGKSAPVAIQNVFNKLFYSELEAGAESEWERLYGHPILKTLYIAFFHGFVIPVRRYYSYLHDDYLRHCPPDHVAAGLVHLPVSYEYLDGKPDFDKPTTTELPLIESRLNGKELYAKILKRYTTLDVTPDEVYEEGKKQVKKFFPELLDVAKNLTATTSETEAIKKIKIMLTSPKQYHGALKFPEIENNSTAFARCKDETSAKKYCPVRWRSMEKWRKYLNRVMAMMHPLLNDVFHFTGEKVTVPNCPIEVRPHFNPTLNSMYYEPSDAECSRPSVFAVPFFWEKYGPKFQEWSIVGHEARPGHYFQIQGAVELFSSPCQQSGKRFYHGKGFFGGFVEGWASYAENPVLSDDVMLYENDKMQKLGMYKWQIWRAIRLIVDTGLHYKNEYNMETAVELFKKYALDDGSEFSRKEIIRYMSEPGQAASYMMGRLEFVKARELVERELKDHFDIKDFHYQVLSLGPVPLDYLSKYVKRYLSCLRKPTTMYCEYLFTPLRTIPKGTYRRRVTMPPLHHHQQQQQQQQKQAQFML